jgi:hypothetical protein
MWIIFGPTDSSKKEPNHKELYFEPVLQGVSFLSERRLYCLCSPPCVVALNHGP